MVFGTRDTSRPEALTQSIYACVRMSQDKLASLTIGSNGSNNSLGLPAPGSRLNESRPSHRDGLKDSLTHFAEPNPTASST
jgi:hypothetical protein